MSEKQKINAAYRLHEILKAAIAQPPNITNLQVWSNVFDVQHAERRPKQAVSRGIDLIYDQLDILVSYLKRNEYAEEVIQNLVNAIEGNISMEFAPSAWQDYRQRLSNQIIPLRIYSNTLPHEENLISPADLKDIQDELDALQLSLDNKDIPTEVREYVKKQFGFIRRAFWEYKFCGLHAFDDAFDDA